MICQVYTLGRIGGPDDQLASLQRSGLFYQFENHCRVPSQCPINDWMILFCAVSVGIKTKKQQESKNGFMLLNYKGKAFIFLPHSIAGMFYNRCNRGENYRRWYYIKLLPQG
jgi:hypothetical protein